MDENFEKDYDNGYSEVKEEIKTKTDFGWSWGAFGLTWIYGIFNKSWPCLISLIPALFGWLFNRPFPAIISLVICIVCGVMGKEWSYKYSQPTDIESWKRKQHNWDIAGIVALIVSIILVFLMLFAIMAFQVTLFSAMMI